MSSWIVLKSVAELVSHVTKSSPGHPTSKTVCLVTASTNCFLCKLVEPKIRSCAWDLEYQDIDFFVIDVDEVDDVELLPENKRPGRVLSQAIRRVYDQSR